jgi:uncharacterized membrane protein
MRDRGFDSTVGRLMIAMTYVAVVLLAIGVILMIANGISPLVGGPVFDAGVVLEELRAGIPTGFIWLGLVVVIATPIVRVAVSSVGFAREGQWRMVGVGLGILTIIAIGIVTSIAMEH